MKVNEIFKDSLEELASAKKKHPREAIDRVHGAGIIGEESGELMQACLDNYYYNSQSIAQIRAEAIQVIASTIRFLENLPDD